MTRTRSAAEWADLLDAAGVPNAPVQSIEQVANHPQTTALDILRVEPNSKQQFFGLPLSFDGIRPDRDDSAPGLGENDDEIKFQLAAQPIK